MCAFDGGDCCGSCILTEYCTECECYHDINSNGIPNALVANGFCNDETNNLECNYDGGDCCGCVLTDYCSDCQCLGGGAPSNSNVGNGICNDEINNEDCNYDGGDCCLWPSLNTEQCLECICSTEGVITSPGFPENYDNGLNVTWLIQVPAGLVIQVNFVNFSVEPLHICR